ncbi:MAG: hypothetical protein NTV22_05060 [bacterium]|nr:hypothetical protein [bacterium]
MKDNPVIERVRAARHRISKECGHSTKRLVERYIRMQKKHAGRMIDPHAATTAKVA